MSVAREEIFGPVASLFESESLEEAVEIINRSPYGNAATIYTSSGKDAREFRSRVRAGNIGINVGVAAPMAYFPFGGMKDSFFGREDAEGDPQDGGHTRGRHDPDRVHDVPFRELHQDIDEPARDDERKERREVREERELVVVHGLAGRVVQSNVQREEKDESERYEDRREDDVFRDVLAPESDEEKDDPREGEDQHDVDGRVRHVAWIREGLETARQEQRGKQNGDDLAADKDGPHRRNRRVLAAHGTTTPGSRVRTPRSRRFSRCTLSRSRLSPSLAHK